MGKRKSSSKPAAKKRADPLATTFKCVFCHRDRSVSVKMEETDVRDKQEMYGHLTCKECGQRFSSPINNLSAAVDVYCDWKDACEEIRLKQDSRTKPIRPPNGIAHGVGGGAAFSAGGRTTEKDADGDAESDEEGGRKVGYLDDEEEGEDEDEAEREAAETVKRKEKKRQKRVEVDSEEDED